MNIKTFFIPLIALFLFNINLGHAQIDDQNNTKTIPAIQAQDTTSIPSIAIKPAAQNIKLSNTNKNNTPAIILKSDTKKEFSMFDDSNLIHPGQIYEKRWAKAKKDAEIKKEYMVDQFLGEFKTGTVFINVKYRDHEYPDGDRIRVLVNEDVIFPQVLLEHNFKGFKLNLNKGLNKIDFLALNQGESGPNTAEFQVLDDNGNIISANRWNLTTGVKASIVILKE